ncbi:ATP-binding cassette domain-containing protein [Mucilaginibacter pedocola]|uniref:ABC transporter n=1 Tax=Mucilaginibacter pedocola TaxID=1792845 RepID=A0A1S9P8G5_9SPHI|nr:ABC transporter ATP-binding protein [Mucilaginibacter pedocola]OOQ57266.1 hypothetical protein BC343_14210 [Mucilaginibacter pedocola]
MVQILKSISRILFPHEKRRLAWLVAFDVFTTLLDIAFLSALVLLVNYYTGTAPNGSKAWLTQMLAGKEPLLLMGVFLLLFAAKNAFGFWVQKKQHHFFYGVASRLSERNILQYLRDGYGRFVHTDSSVEMRRISNQPIEFSHHILTGLQQMVSQGLLVAFTLTVLLLYHPALVLALTLLLLPPSLALHYFSRRKLTALKQQIKATNAKVIQHLNESLAGYVESNIYDGEGFFSRRYLRYQQGLNNTLASQQTWQALPARAMEVFAVAGILMLVVLSKSNGPVAGMDMLTIGVFMAAAYKVMPALVKMMNSAGQIKTYEFILDSLMPNKELNTSPKATINEIDNIEFKDVVFSYPQRRVLEGLSFELSKGDLLGLSAVSGKGKTTIINLLLGFLEVEDGNISINHKPTAFADRAAYRSHISLVKQQPFFIHNTLIKNITLSDDEPDRPRLQYALQFCGLDKVLTQYPDGINQLITENGKNISGGQRQRLALARAIYHDFDLLILDEPFSEMDSDAEQEILLRLAELVAGGKIVILITHNKASLAFCTKVLNLTEAYA